MNFFGIEISDGRFYKAMMWAQSFEFPLRDYAQKVIASALGFGSVEDE